MTAHRSTDLPARALAAALALTAANPVSTADLPRSALLVPAGLLAAWWAGPAVVRRPVRDSATWRAQLSRHRNTAFAAGCVLLAAATSPPPWLAACVTALLLGYLLLVDAAAAGPAGHRLWQRWVPATAFAAGGLVLLASFTPVDGAAWGRLVAALAVSGSAAVVGVVVWARNGSERPDPRPAQVGQRTVRTGPRHR